MYGKVLSIGFKNFNLGNSMYIMSEYFIGMLILHYWLLNILGIQTRLVFHWGILYPRVSINALDDKLKSHTAFEIYMPASFVNLFYKVLLTKFPCDL